MKNLDPRTQLDAMIMLTKVGQEPGVFLPINWNNMEEILENIRKHMREQEVLIENLRERIDDLEAENG